MPFDLQVTARHFASHTQDMPCEVRMGNVRTQASKGSNILGRQFMEAGGTLTYDFSIWIPRSDKVRQRPALKSVFRVDGEEYRVGNVEEYSDGAGWRIDLGHPEDFSL
jgi:hypothetical protein